MISVLCIKNLHRFTDHSMPNGLSKESFVSEQFKASFALR
jgi:hypothetical protein